MTVMGVGTRILKIQCWSISCGVINISSNSFVALLNKPKLDESILNWQPFLLSPEDVSLSPSITFHLLTQFGSPTEPAWGLPQSCVNLSRNVELFLLVQKMHHIYHQFNFFTGHQHLKDYQMYKIYP
jgi:hypothetical protein